jgi:hypothetical protein
MNGERTFALAHRTRPSEHCYFCGRESRNTIHARDPKDGERIKVCRRSECIERLERQ